MFIHSFQAVASLLTLGILGFWIVSRKIIPTQLFAPLITLAVQIALPCMIFTNIFKKFNPSKMTDWWVLPLWWVGFTAIVFILGLLFSRLIKLSERKEFLVSLVFQNGIFFPVAFLGSMFGANHIILVYLFIFVVFYPAYFFFLMPQLLEKQSRRFSFSSLVNPVMIATIMAVIIVTLGLRPWIPAFAINSLSMVGYITIPIIFLILGGNIYMDVKNRGKLYWGTIIKFVFIKNFIFPLILGALLVWLQPPAIIAFIIILQAASPPLTLVPIMVERGGGNQNIANQLLLFSFITTLLSIPLVIYLFGRFFTISF